MIAHTRDGVVEGSERDSCQRKEGPFVQAG